MQRGEQQRRGLRFPAPTTSTRRLTRSAWHRCSPCAHSADLGVSWTRRRTESIVPRNSEPIADHANVCGVNTVDMLPDSEVPVTRRPCASTGGKCHTDYGESRDFAHQIRVAGLRVAVRTAHRLPPRCSWMTVKQHQTAMIASGNLGCTQYVVSGNRHIAVDVSVHRSRAGSLRVSVRSPGSSQTTGDRVARQTSSCPSARTSWPISSFSVAPVIATEVWRVMWLPD